jgi:O-succinylbenzoate synthase
MPLSGSFFSKIFVFGFDARTSRGPMRDKRSWFIRISDTRYPNVVGIGECGPLPGLSVDDVPHFETVLGDVLQRIEGQEVPPNIEEWVRQIVPARYPSVTFGLETALLDLVHGGKRLLFDNDFARGVPVPINGLVWMSDVESMLRQANQLVGRGFTCIKIKVGGCDFDEECRMLRAFREVHDRNHITLRLDANGAFAPDEALDKLSRLSEFDVHSIEQPIKARLPEMASICSESPIPIALDEELIGKEEAKDALLDTIMPAFIVLKPTLHGGMLHCREWISKAEERGIGWWITSALESSIGLNAISQFVASFRPTIPQGLGTGSIYTNNIGSPLKVENGSLRSDPRGSWEPL